MQPDSINLKSNHWFQFGSQHAQWLWLHVRSRHGHFGQGLGVFFFIWFQVDVFRLNIGMSCLGFMLSYIQPNSINLKSNHWFQVDYRHGKWFGIHMWVVTLDMASDFLGFDVWFDFKLIVSGWMWACHVSISCLATFNRTRLIWNQIIGWRFSLGMPSGTYFMWEWPPWIRPRISWGMMFDLNSSLLIPVVCIHATFGFHV